MNGTSGKSCAVGAGLSPKAVENVPCADTFIASAQVPGSIIASEETAKRISASRGRRLRIAPKQAIMAVGTLANSVYNPAVPDGTKEHSIIDDGLNTHRIFRNTPQRRNPRGWLDDYAGKD